MGEGDLQSTLFRGSDFRAHIRLLECLSLSLDYKGNLEWLCPYIECEDVPTFTALIWRRQCWYKHWPPEIFPQDNRSSRHSFQSGGEKQRCTSSSLSFFFFFSSLTMISFFSCLPHPHTSADTHCGIILHFFWKRAFLIFINNFPSFLQLWIKQADMNIQKFTSGIWNPGIC